MVEGGKLCSDKRYKPILDAKKCRSIASRFGFKAKRIIKRRNPDAPPGCNIVTAPFGGSFQKTVRFNRIRVAVPKRSYFFSPICKKRFEKYLLITRDR